MYVVNKLLEIDQIGLLQIPYRRVDVPITEVSPCLDVVLIYMSGCGESSAYKVSCTRLLLNAPI
jgi:hypothetical protein